MATANPWIHKMYDTVEERGLLDMRLLQEDRDQEFHNALAVVAAHSSINFRSASRIGDVFNKLPAELLYLIFREVMLHPGQPFRMSPDLLKLGLVSKRFDSIALNIWIGTLRYGKSLYIDPAKRSLEEILKIFAPADVGRAWASTIIDVELRIRPIIKYKGLEKMINDLIKCHWDEDLHEADQNLEMSVKHNLAQFHRIWKQQQALQRFLASSTGKKQLHEMLLSMPKLRSLHISMREFWMIGFSEALVRAEAPPDPSKVYWQLVPHLMKLLAESKVSRLSLHIDASFMRSMRQSFLERLLRRRPVQLNMLKSIILHVFNDDLICKGHEYGEEPLAHAADFHNFFTRLPNLESLSLQRRKLNYTDVWSENDFTELGEAAWLSRVLCKQYWPHLGKLDLSSFVLPVKDIISILRRHKTSLREVDFDDCALETHDDAMKLVNVLREELTLSECFLGIGVMKDEVMSGELKLIADAYCGQWQRKREKLIPRPYSCNHFTRRMYNLGHYVLGHDPPA